MRGKSVYLVFVVPESLYTQIKNDRPCDSVYLIQGFLLKLFKKKRNKQVPHTEWKDEWIPLMRPLDVETFKMVHRIFADKK